MKTQGGAVEEDSQELGFIRDWIRKSPNNKFSDEELRDKSFFELFDQKYKEVSEENQKQKNASGYDVPSLEAEISDREQYYSDRSNSTWRQRLDYMWKPNERGYLSPELQFVWEGTFGSFLIAAMYGSYTESAKIYRIFLEQNKYTMFQHPREAQRALQDRVVLAMMQGGWRMGWRFGLVTATFLSVTQSLTVIRNSINPLDYAAGGLAMGAVYRFNMGPRGMVGAGMAGAIYGLGTGLIVSWIQLVSGESVADRWNREFISIEQKKRAKEAAAAKKAIAARKDVRDQDVEQETRKSEHRVVVPEETTPYKLDAEDYVRLAWIKLTRLLETIGILTPGDRYTVVEGDDDSELVSDSDSRIR